VDSGKCSRFWDAYVADQPGFPLIIIIQIGNNIQQGCFSTAGRTHQANKFAGLSDSLRSAIAKLMPRLFYGRVNFAIDVDLNIRHRRHRWDFLSSGSILSALSVE